MIQLIILALILFGLVLWGLNGMGESENWLTRCIPEPVIAWGIAGFLIYKYFLSS